MSLRYVIFGGEALELQSLRPWFERYGDERPRLVNMYGITETTVHVTYRPIRLADVEAGAGSVIGVPIPDLQLYVLDAARQPVPIGVAGELYVGGDGVARGYLNRPELTAERFVENPFVQGARLYRSGDLARRLPDGDLEYLGRIDQQVKIRGFRIELGEIESVISQHPGVRETVVLAREDASGDRRLVAFVATGGERSIFVDGLRAFSRLRLPDYMVPSHFALLDALPLTPNGKVDRKALAKMDTGAAPLGTEHVAPRTPTEEIVASAWAETLDVRAPGIHDNFFEVGGHSMSAARLMARLRAGFGFEVGLRSLFERPTIAGLAEVIDVLRLSQAHRGPEIGSPGREEFEF
jgi:acyl-CoA synthetase (AMP-forming)/AMP-acid ligase II/aryl carrier-like protein